jgi:tRNA threonylcarbamoyladenosine biosynthesis protein TsaE
MKRVITKSPEETITLGQKIAAELKGQEIIGLIGDLGAGKTQLVKGIAQGLRCKEIVVSPTFTLIREYKCREDKQLFHMDFYRLSSSLEVETLGFEDYIGRGIIIIEWFDKIKAGFKEDYSLIEIKIKDKNIREFKFKDSK